MLLLELSLNHSISLPGTKDSVTLLCVISKIDKGYIFSNGYFDTPL